MVDRRKSTRRPRQWRRRSRHCDDSDEEEELPRGRGLHWYLIGCSLVLVILLSCANFLALPKVTYHPHLRPSLLGDPLYDDELDLRGIHSPGARYRGDAFLQKTPQSEMQQPWPPASVDHAARSNGADGTAPHAARSPADAAAAAAAPGVDVSAAPILLSRSMVAPQGGVLYLNGEQWLETETNPDAAEVTFAAWIYMPDVPAHLMPGTSSSMKTIASTKISGCHPSAKSPGWSLFVHEWGTLNRQLRLSWTDQSSACHEVFSKDFLVPLNMWVQVGFSLSRNLRRVRLVLGGQAIVDSAAGIGVYAKQGQGLSMHEVDITTRTVAAASQPLYVGAHMPSDKDRLQSHMFLGFIGSFMLAHRVLEDPALELRLVAGCASEAVTLAFPDVSRVVQVAFKKDTRVINAFNGRGLDTFATADGPKEVTLLDWAEHPERPDDAPAALSPGVEPGGSTEPPPAGPRLSPDELRKTFPAEWLSKYSEDELIKSQQEADSWADEVREAARHTWRGYKSKAWGHDDLKTVSGKPADWCRLAVTMVDGLSTLWLMGLKTEFQDAASWLASENMPTPGKHGPHSLFEITIRVLGGLVSAWHLSGQAVFLDTARRLAEKLMPAFQTSNGMPKNQVDVGTGDTKWVSWTKNALLAEAGTLQMEFGALSHETGDPKFEAAADKSMQSILDAAGGRGLVPIYLTREGNPPKFNSKKFSIGAMGDSYYEYLLKHWLQSGKRKGHLKESWKTSMREMIEQMVTKTKGGTTFIAELLNGRKRNRMDHLACFVAGMLMLGSRSLPKEEVDPRWEPLAAEITETCYRMYKFTQTGLAPEYVIFDLNGAQSHDMSIPNDAPHNLLRPEAAEAIYYMWYYTGDPKYRHMAHEMFQGFQKYTKAMWGYTAIANVNKIPVKPRDSQESFWIAETLKYFYLIFSPRSTLNLEEWVLNTEAQPMKVWK
mmetsp:Transcript_108254/g.312856  ORF Transcript_108254/g.312856 Transcript_108254/m.312856 type:complete len:943 (-) Transcript_108254:23-2851(-)